MEVCIAHLLYFSTQTLDGIHVFVVWNGMRFTLLRFVLSTGFVIMSTMCTAALVLLAFSCCCKGNGGESMMSKQSACSQCFYKSRGKKNFMIWHFLRHILIIKVCVY